MEILFKIRNLHLIKNSSGELEIWNKKNNAIYYFGIYNGKLVINITGVTHSRADLQKKYQKAEEFLKLASEKGYCQLV